VCAWFACVDTARRQVSHEQNDVDRYQRGYAKVVKEQNKYLHCVFSSEQERQDDREQRGILLYRVLTTITVLEITNDQKQNAQIYRTEILLRSPTITKTFVSSNDKKAIEREVSTKGIRARSCSSRIIPRSFAFGPVNCRCPRRGYVPG
jgi:hypothetical protein